MAAAYNLTGLLGAAVGGSEEVKQIPIDMLVPYHEHRFELYSGERMDDMVESIRKHGIFQPILVMELNDGEEYEILAGHNRWNCAIKAGLDRVPCIVKHGLTKKEQQAYVDESNVLQRGFDNLKISERARVLKERYEDMFEQGKRNDIIAELAAYENNDKPAGGRTGARLGNEYGLGKSSVARYVRLASIDNDYIVNWIDSGVVSVRAGVELSYISAGELDLIVSLVDTPKKQLSEKKARMLRDAAAEGELDEERIIELISSQMPKSKVKRIVLPEHIVEEFFCDFSSQEIVEKIVNLLERDRYETSSPVGNKLEMGEKDS